MKKSIFSRSILATSAVSLSLLAGSIFNVTLAHAASLTAISDTMSNETAAASSSHVFKFTTPTGISSSKTFIVFFPSGFNLTGSVFGNVSITYGASTGLENSTTTAASPSATVWGVAFSGTNNTLMTLSSPTSGAGIPAGNTMIVTLASSSAVNPSAGNYTINLGGATSTASDSGSVTVPILSNSQVLVSATVPQSLTFSLGSTTVSFGTLSVTGSSSASSSMTLATNGVSGATITVSGTTLTSGTSTTIAACTGGCTSTVGTAQFGLNLAANAGIGSAPSGSAPIASAASGYGTANNFKFNSGDTIASASNAINTTTFVISYLANIAGVTPAGSYSSTLTYNATANF